MAEWLAAKDAYLAMRSSDKFLRMFFPAMLLYSIPYSLITAIYMWDRVANSIVVECH